MYLLYFTLTDIYILAYLPLPPLLGIAVAYFGAM